MALEPLLRARSPPAPSHKLIETHKYRERIQLTGGIKRLAVLFHFANINRLWRDKRRPIYV